jgi:hypothetical protein
VRIDGSVIGGGDSSAGGISAVNIGKIEIDQSLRGGVGQASGQIVSEDSIGEVIIKGDVAGGAGDFSGRIAASNLLGQVRIGGSLIGGAGTDSGKVTGNLGIDSVRIHASIIGGSSDQAGEVASSGSIDRVIVDGDVRALVGAETARIVSGENIGLVKIGGSLIGGVRESSGVISAIGDLGKVVISGDLIGGSVRGIASLERSGYITAVNAESIQIGGSIISGVDDSTGDLFDSGAIRIGSELGQLNVAGGIVGNISEHARITAGRSIGTIEVGKSVEWANILAGYNRDSIPQPENGDAQIGKVRVGGDWQASFLIAGVTDGGDGFANGDDPVIAGSNPSLVSRIASVVIGGQARGPDPGALVVLIGSFGFYAEEIAKFRIGNTVIPLTAGASNDTDPDSPLLVVDGNGFVRIRES